MCLKVETRVMSENINLTDKMMVVESIYLLGTHLISFIYVISSNTSYVSQMSKLTPKSRAIRFQPWSLVLGKSRKI